MGRDANEEAERRGRPARKPKKYTGGRGKLVNFSPTESHKNSLREGAIGLVDALGSIEDALTMGCRLSVGVAVDKGGAFVILREPTDDWENALSVSFWAVSVEKAIMLCGYYLSHVNPSFPEGVQLALPYDW